MRISKSQQIGKEAEDVLQSMLPKTWNINPQKNDFGKDYYVEVGDEAGNLTGVSFVIQLKGHEKPKLRASFGCVNESLTRKHAVYYLDHVRDVPAFLVVVDTIRRTAWFMFLQQTLDLDQSWRSRKSATLRIPVTNDLSNTVHFTDAVLKAVQTLKLMNGSISDGIKAEAYRLKQREPRLRIAKANIVEGQPTQLHLAPTEDFSFKIRMPVEKRVDFYERGLPVKFAPGELTAEGTRYFEPVTKSGGVVSATKVCEGDFLVSCRGEHDEIVAELSFAGTFEGGASEGRFHGRFKNSPFVIDLNPWFRRFDNDTPCHASISAKFSGWSGQRIDSLSWFDDLYRLSNALCQGQRLFGRACIRGRYGEFLEMHFQGQQCSESFGWIMKSLYKARWVCAFIGINPTLSWSKFNESIDTIDELYELLQGRSYQASLEQCELQMKVGEKGLSLLESLGNEIMLQETRRVSSFQLLGVECDFPRVVRRTFANLSPEIVSRGEEGKESEVVLRAISGATVKVEFVDAIKDDVPFKGLTLDLAGE